ncbi:MAG: S-adenosylmethionine:tRNA ribosyltransferase-isomerase [Bacteroidales bacterium]|nr:S-adenosylmethionine:tRNA ribosyltransferase-isomerase [Bacteroidales bacterium]
MNPTKDSTPIYIDEYNYPLPDERIAKYPLAKRDASKLLVYRNARITESVFSSISDFLPDNALLIYNNTRVIQARLLFKKDTGAHIEVFCLEPLQPADYAQSLGATTECVWKCMIGNLKKWKEGGLSKQIEMAGEKCTFTAERLQTEGNTHSVRFSWDNANIHFADILENAGELPIPPYLHRKTEESDLTTYQTVYSKIKGSVAAPTAGLHFTEEVFESLKPKQIAIDEVTLHVGAGTFQPVKTRDIAEHHMHTEVISVQRSTIENLLKKLGNIIAVGTTSVRTLESLYYMGRQVKEGEGKGEGTGKGTGEGTGEENMELSVSQWEPYENNKEVSTSDALQSLLDYLYKNNLTTLHAETQIMIRPGYKFRVVDGMITNFHQPKSTLLLLVSAFVDGNWKQIYDYALENDFRFLSYGDSSLLLI